VYVAVSFTLSWLRAVELQTGTWDQGIYQQALWSTAHGRAFYEAADLETGGYHSLLQVHTVFLLYLLVPVYAALPYSTTLFAVQSVIVGAAAIPLYLLARDVTGSPRLALGTGVLYLVWTPVLSSNLFDFHAEAFVPLELFAIVLLWERERYWSGAAAVAIAFATMEITPVLTFFVGLFFLLPASENWRRGWTGAVDSSRWSTRAATVRRALSSPRVRASLGLMVASAGAYYFLLYLQVDTLTNLLGTTPLASAPTGYVIGGTLPALGLSLQNLGMGFATKVTYWILILALLGFVPLFAPRALVISVPWFCFTMLTSRLNYVDLGFQYGFLVAASMMVAFSYGLPRAVAIARSVPAAVAHRGSGEFSRTDRADMRGPRSRHRTLLGILVILVALNIALSPIDPWMQNPGGNGAYRISYSPAPGFVNVERMAGLIPAGATVIASEMLFPLVANDRNAYSFFWARNNLLALPFNASHLPAYVFVAGAGTTAVPAWLSSELYASADFGVRAVTWSSAAGPVLLFQRGYSGATTTYGRPPTVPSIYSGPSLVNSYAGYVTVLPGSNGAPVVASVPGTIGTFFDGPSTNLPSGNLTVVLLVHAAAVAGGGALPPSQSVLSVEGSAFAQPDYFEEALTFGALSAPGWVALAFAITVPGPTIQFAVQGVALSPDAQLFLETIDVQTS
jgi:uncharacterized membrane protein